MGTRNIHVPHPTLFAKGAALLKLEHVMRSEHFSSATGARPIVLQADRVRRRIVASDAVAALVAELAFGPTRRDDDAALWVVTAGRTATAGMVRQ